MVIMPRIEREVFSIEASNGKIEIEFLRKNDFSAVRQLEFSSRLLYLYKPDSTGKWKTNQRSTFYIKGFPPQVSWSAPDTKKMLGVCAPGFVLTDAFLNDLATAIENICPADITGNEPPYKFAITDGAGTNTYTFNKRARAVCALAVLYDLEWHPRQDLEIWINPDWTPNLEPGASVDLRKSEEQFYGDPSKIADELRNEGLTRETATPQMEVESRRVNGQSQQHYRILSRAQPLGSQTRRTNIKSAWREALFLQHGHVCQICLNEYQDSPEQLSPDHRVPVIFEADNLDDSNYATKLMTLCRFCNQAKREFTKRVTDDYDWSTSPWAYPERYRTVIIENQLKAIARDSALSYEEIVKSILDKLTAIPESS